MHTKRHSQTEATLRNQVHAWFYKNKTKQLHTYTRAHTHICTHRETHTVDSKLHINPKASAKHEDSKLKLVIYFEIKLHPFTCTESGILQLYNHTVFKDLYIQ